MNNFLKRSQQERRSHNLRLAMPLLIIFFAVFSGTMAFAIPWRPGQYLANPVVEGIPIRLYHVAVRFSPGSAVLSKTAENQLDRLIEQVHVVGTTARVNVAARADKLLRNGIAMSDDDVELARLRANAVYTYLEETKSISNIVKFNLADPTRWLATTVASNPNTPLFNKKGASPPLTEREIDLIRDKERKSTVSVVVRGLPMITSP